MGGLAGTMRRAGTALALAWIPFVMAAAAQPQPAGPAPAPAVKAPALPMPRPSPVDTGESARAQVEMLERVEEAVHRYAAQLGLDESFVQYCRVEMRIRLQEQVKSGNPVFNFAPERIRSAAALNAVISMRESYERNFQIVCLAQAKAALSAAGLPKP
jgi:hypothetical protein